MANDGYIVRMQGQNVAREDDYYLRFTQETPGFGKEGVWKECASPEGRCTSSMWNTMPHVLEYTDAGFAFGPGSGFLEKWVTTSPILSLLS